MSDEKTVTKGHVLDAAAATLAVELPCGYLDADGRVHRELVVREMTGHEEDLLAGKGPVMQRLNQIIANCAVRIGDIEDRPALGAAMAALTASDRMVAFLAIRRVSLGDFYDVKVTCPSPECAADVRYSLNLAEIEMRPMADPAQRKFEHTLASGRVVRWHVMEAADEVWLTARGKRKEDVMTLALMARVEAVVDANGEHLVDRAAMKGERESMSYLKGLPARDRNEVRTLFERHEGHVDTTVDFVCPTCQHEWKADLNLGQPGFFFPSAT